MKYKLLKDLPGYKAGEVIDTTGIYYPTEFVANCYPDFFEPVRWKPKMNETFWSLDAFYGVIRDKWLDFGIDNKKYKEGLVFQTESEAQEWSTKIKELLSSRFKE